VLIVDALIAPPKVIFPVEATVPERVTPFIVPVPLTEVTVPLLVAAIEIEPAPLVIEMPVLAVSVAFTKVPPVVLPISN
jgi:hypothetical protein